MTGREASPDNAPPAMPRPTAALELGRAARVRGEHVAALEHFADAARAAPASPWPRLEYAATLRALARAAEAEALYAAVFGDHPDNLQALLGLGQLAAARGEHRAALERFAAAEAVASPTNPWPRLDKAAALRALGRETEAEAVLLAVLADLPDTPQALLALGQLSRARGDHAGALDRFRSANRQATIAPWPDLEEAATLRLMGREAEAQETYAAVLRDHPGNPQALLGLGHLARDVGDRAAAVAHFRRAAEANPRSSAAWLELAAESREAGDFDGARDTARRVLAADGADLQAWLSLGRTERAAGRREAALTGFRSASERHPANPFPLVEMAMECRALGQVGEAEALLLRALELDEANVQALEQLGDLARTSRDYDCALVRYTAARNVRPSNPWPWLGLVRTLAEMGHGSEALERLAEAEIYCGASPDIEGARVDLLRQSGDWRAAHLAVQRASTQWPRHLGLWLHRFRLERLLSAPEEVEACLGAAPGGSFNAKVRLRHFRGLAAEEEWHLERAAAHYRDALALRPDDTWVLSDLTRVAILTLDVEAAASNLDLLTRLTAVDARLKGRVARASQTHFGQILDEFTIDTLALSQLKAMRGLSADERIEPLLRMVRRRPDHTPSAMMLMIALRQAGRLTPPPGRDASDGPRVPRQMVQYWDAPDVPPELEALARTWRDMHPCWPVRRFDDQTAQEWLADSCAPAVLEAYRRAREPAQKADLFRLAWLFSEGGWWIDLDDRCLAPLETVAPPGAGLVLYQEEYGTVGNNVIGAAPQHPVIGEALDSAVEAVNRGDGDILWFSTGPGLLTRALASMLARPGPSSRTWLRNIHVATRAGMHRAVAMHCQVAYKQTGRHWSQTAFAAAPPAPGRHERAAS